MDALGLARAAVPGLDGRPLFPAPWHARVFALIVVLVEEERLTWVSFQGRLVAALARRRGRPATAEEIEREHFDCWLEAAEETLRDDGFLDPEDVAHRIEWIRASVAAIRDEQSASGRA